MLKIKKEILKIGCADYIIGLTFEVDEFGYARALIDQIKKIWSALLVKSSAKTDFELHFGFRTDQFLVRKSRYYCLMAERDFNHRRAICPVSISLPNLNLLLKEVFAYLLQNDGFFLHASSFLDREGTLHLFLAPSGGGKSTVVGLLADKNKKQLFSDDILLAKRVKHKWFFYSPPFIEKGKTPLKLSSAKAKIYFIKKAQKAGRQEIDDKKDILKELIAKVWFNHPEIPPTTLKQIIRFVNGNRFYRVDSVLDRAKMRKVILNEN